MILPPFAYLRPHSLGGALSLLSDVDGAAVLAGGQTLLNVLKLDMAAPAALVDIHRLAELRAIEVRPDGTLTIGAAVTYAELASNPVVSEHQPSVSAMAAGLVDRQVRNRGTIGGNCCLNDPTNNFPPLLMALDANFHLISTSGTRVLPAEAFFTGTLNTALAADEILAAVEIPALPETAHVVHQHMQVGADSWAIARSVVRLDIDNGEVTAARAIAGAVVNSPVRLPMVEAALVGSRADKELSRNAAAAFDRSDVQTVDDVHCSARYRHRISKIQLLRAVTAAVEGSAP